MYYGEIEGRFANFGGRFSRFLNTIKDFILHVLRRASREKPRNTNEITLGLSVFCSEVLMGWETL